MPKVSEDQMGQKMTGAKKVILMKNQFFHARQPREEIFEFCSCSGTSHARVLFTWSHLAPARALQNYINGQYVPLFIRLNKRTNSMLNSLVQSVSFISNNFWSS